MELESFNAWRNKTVVLKFNDGERTVAHILSVDETNSQLIVDVIESNRPYPEKERRARPVRFGLVMAVKPVLDRAENTYLSPSSDECRSWQSFSGGRVILFMILGLFMGPVSFALFLLLAAHTYGIQFASTVAYSAAIGICTFASYRGMQAFLFDCPFVQSQIPHLYRRHAAFLAGLVVFQTIALHIRPHLSDFWLTSSGRNMPPFDLALLFFCIGLGLVQTMTNRSLLNKAHLYP